MQKKIYLTVTNELRYDQRMQRICTSLASFGYDVTLVGRKKLNSPTLEQQKFKQKRLRCFINKGKFFYIVFNIRLFFYLLFKKTDAFCTIDLDTILPTLFIAKIRKKTLIYDAHEYFTEVPEVINRPRIQKIWQKIELFSVPKVDFAYTVSHSIAELLAQQYCKSFGVIRNMPYSNENMQNPKQENFVLYQGAINNGRGLDLVLKSFKDIDYQLVLAGDGDIRDELAKLSNSLNLNEKVRFTGNLAPKELQILTPKAKIGLHVSPPMGVNNELSLANKFFEYIQAGVPAIVTRFPEYEKINEQYEICYFIDELTKENLQNAIAELLQNQELYNKLRENCLKYRHELTWEKEELKLKEFYENVFKG